MVVIIKKGSHKNFRLPHLTFSKRIFGKVTFKGDFSYSIERQGDTNKLVGLSDGFGHHSHSIRIGWRYYHFKHEIMTIQYIDGKRKIKHLCYFEPNKEYNYEIEIKNNEYIVIFGDNYVSLPRKSNWWFIRYLLMPYFGGKTLAPKDFEIELTKTVI